jgi:hypothetical protein
MATEESSARLLVARPLCHETGSPSGVAESYGLIELQHFGTDTLRIARDCPADADATPTTRGRDYAGS